MKQYLERLELARRWATTFLVLLVVPMMHLQLSNVKLELQRYADSNFIEKKDYRETWAEHNETRDKLVSKLQGQIDITSTEYRSLNQKIDLMSYNVKDLQTQLLEMRNRLERRP